MDSRKFTLDANNKLGSGSYGSVFTASMLHQGKRINIAVKRIENDGLGNVYADSGRKEYDILMAIGQHENVVKLLGFESDKHFLYILMELGTEGNLEEYLEKVIPDLEEKIGIMHGCSKALNYMHTRHPPIVHRDIKSENVIIHRSDNGQIIAKMADFGQSRVFDPEGKKQFMSTDRGCLLFKSPELFTRGRKQYTCAVDTFSMGLVFMVMLNYTENNKCLEPTPVSLQDSPMLFYGQRLSLANEQKTPWPVLFSLTSDDCFPVTELKTVITLMTRYRQEDRIKMQHVESVFKAIITNAHREDVHSLVGYLESDRSDARTETETLQQRISSQQQHLCSLRQQNHELKNEVEKLKDQVRRRDSQLSEGEVKVGAALKQPKTALSDVFQHRLSDEMSTKLSRDESSLENVSIKNRPMNITAEYQQLCSEQWLEAKAAVDEATKTRGNTEKEKHEFLLDIFMQAEERAVEVLNQSNNNIYELILNPPGKSYRSSYKSEEKPFDVSQVPEKVQTSISDFRRTAVESTDLSEIIAQVEKSLNTSYGTVGYEVKYKYEAKQAVSSLICAVVSLVWKMVNQRPAMRFITPGVREPYDANIQEICWGSPDLHGRSMYVDVYSHPVLMHGDKVMAKGKVLIKERY